ANQNDKAIAALQEGATLFPQNGEIEFQLAQAYLQMENTELALKHAQAAAAKGNFESTKPFSVYHFIAYAAFDLDKLEEAAAAVKKAEALPEAATDPQFPRLKEIVLETIETQEREKAEAAAAATKS